MTHRFDPISSPIDGTTLIEASAGTGKTFSMALLMLRFVLDGKKIDEILAVTFTRAAISELKERVRLFVDEALQFIKTNPQPKLDESLTQVEQLTVIAATKNGIILTHDRLKTAYTNIDTAAIFTIHAFCHRIVQEYAFETSTPYSTELVGENRETTLEIAQNYWLKTLLAPGTPHNFVAHITETVAPDTLVKYLRHWHTTGEISDAPSSLSYSWEEGKTAVSLDIVADSRLFIYRFLTSYAPQMEQKSSEQGVITYDSLISIVSNALKNDETKEFLTTAVRKRYKVALIDEFQDTDSEQYTIFSTFFGNENQPLICIGDPKQAIYSFRKADLHTYLEATSEERLTYRYSLGINWRSSDSMIDAVNTFFMTAKEKVRHPFIIPEISFQPVDASQKIEPLKISGTEVAPLVIPYLEAASVAQHHLSRSKDIMVGGKAYLAEYVAGEILFLLNPKTEAELKKEKPVTPSDIAILVASHKDAEQFKTVLMHHDIPASILYQTSIFHTAVAKELWTVMTAIVERSYGVMKSAIVTDIIGGTLQDDSFLEKFYDWWLEWQHKGFLAAFSLISTDLKMRSRLAKREDGERILTDIRHLSETLHAEEWSSKLTPYELLQWFGQKIASATHNEAAQLRMDSDEKAVTILTLHTAKGLQWPIVFVSSLFSEAKMFGKEKSGRYHNENKQSVYNFIAPGEKWSPPVKRAIDEEILAEKIRLLYVGITRAEKRCYLLSGRFHTLGTSPIGYLMHGMRSFYDLKKLSDDDLIDDIKQFCTSKNIVTVPPKNSSSNKRFLSQNRAINKPAKKFSRIVDNSWAVTSYSALTSHRGDEQDFDFMFYTPPEEEEDTPDEPEKIFDFPAGPRAGTALHKIFEDIDFIDKPSFSSAIEHALSSFSLLTDSEGNSHLDTIVEMVDHVLNTQLPDGPKLSTISLKESVRELEFFFPFEQIDGEKLMKVINDDMTHISFEEVQGFLHGFVDLIFRHEEKFYIVDWKSNLLGKSVAYYTQSHLKEAMADHNYRLQYLLYSVALHRWLEVTLDDYDFETHFGGVYYLFLRGIRKGKTTGIWHEKPTKELISRIDTFLGGKK